MSLVITELLNCPLTELLGRIVTKLVHKGCDLLSAFLALHGDSVLTFLVVAVLVVHIDHSVPNALALLLVESSELAEHHNRYNSVLISCVGSCQASVRLLETEYIVVALAVLLEELDLLADVLKACENLDVLKAIVLSNSLSHVGCNDCCNERRVSGHCACSLTLS